MRIRAIVLISCLPRKTGSLSTFRITLLAWASRVPLVIWTITPWCGLVLSTPLTWIRQAWGALLVMAVRTRVLFALILRVNVIGTARLEKFACAALQILPLLPTWTSLTVRVSRNPFPSLFGSFIAFTSYLATLYGMTLLSCRVTSLLALLLSTGRFSFVKIFPLGLIKARAFILVEELCIYTFVCYRVVVVL